MSSGKCHPFCLGLNVLKEATVIHWPCQTDNLSQQMMVTNYPVLVPFVALINSLAPGRSECDSKNVIFSLVLLIGIFRSTHDNALWWMPQDLTDDKSILVQVMAWCHQATSHYLSQCWLSSLSPYGATRPQWVKQWHVTYSRTLQITCLTKKLNSSPWRWGIEFSLWVHRPNCTLNLVIVMLYVLMYHNKLL